MSSGRPPRGDGELDRVTTDPPAKEQAAPKPVHLEIDDDRYEVLRVLDQHGDTYLAKVGDRVVVLTLTRHATPLAFLAELDHPNIARVHDLVKSTDERAAYLVTEHVTGTSLRELTGSPPTVPLRRVLAYGLQLLSAVGYLRDHGLSHTDLKPANMIDTGARLKLVGLEAVRRIEEHADGGVASDLYAVGRLLVNLRTVGESESYQRFLRRASTRDPRLRFTSVEEMAAQLAGVLREARAVDEGVPQPGSSTLFGPPVEHFGGVTTSPEPALTLPPVHEVIAALPTPLAGSAGSELWLAEWRRGLAVLADGRIRDALEAFAVVYDQVPGELAPKLALAVCMEWQGYPDAAGKFYKTVWRTDDTYLSAAFGLARTSLALSDEDSAIAVLDSVPQDSPWHGGAQLAVIAILTSGPLSEHDLVDAAERLSRLPLDDGERRRLSLAMVNIAHRWVRSLPPGSRPSGKVLGWALTERDLRAARRRYRLGREPRWHTFVGGLAESLAFAPPRPRAPRSSWERVEARIHERYDKLGPPEPIRKDEPK